MLYRSCEGLHYGASVKYFFETLGWAETCDFGIWAGIARLKT